MHRDAFTLFSVQRETIHRASVVLAAVLAFSTSAAAQTFIWTQAAGTTNWNTAANWTPAAVPNSATADVIFGTTGVGTVNIAGSVQAQSLTFATSGGSGYTLTSGAGQTLSGVSAISVTGFISGTAHTIDLANVAAGSLLVPGTGPAALTISNGATTGTLSLTIGPNTVIGRTGGGTAGIAINGRGHTRISGTIASSINDGLTFSGPGFLAISGTNNATGATTLGGGTLTLDYGTNATSKLPNGAITSAGGELVMLAHGTTSLVESVSSTSLTAGHLQLSIDTNTGALADLSLTLGAITRSAGSTAQFKTETGGAITTTTGTINGILGGWATADDSNWATKSGANMIPLAAYGNDIYSAGTNTNVTTGVGIPSNFTTNSLRFNTDVPGGMTATLSGTNSIQSGGILMGAGAGDVTITGGNIQSGAGGEVIIHQNGLPSDLTINSTILAPTGLTKTGAGRLILGGSTTTIDGPINVNRGSIRFTTLSAVSGFGVLSFNDNRSAASQRLEVELGEDNSASSGASIRLKSGVGSFPNVFANNSRNSRVTFSGVISSPPGAVTPLRIDSSFDTGRIELTGTNTFTGDITLIGGTLAIDADSSLGNSANTLILAVNNTTAGGLEFLAGGANLARPISINASTRVLSPGAFINTISGVISSPNSTAALVKAGTGTLVLTGDNSSWIGPLNIDAGTVRVASAANLGGTAALSIGGTLEITDNLTSARPIALGPAEGGPGPGTFDVASSKTVTLTGLVGNRTTTTTLGVLVKAGPGTLVLTNANNSYSGGTRVEQGILQAASNAALGAATAPVTVEPLGALTFTGSTSTGRTYSLNSSTLSAGSGATVTFHNAAIGGGFLTGPGAFATQAGGSNTFVGSQTTTSSNLTFNGTDTLTNFSNGGLLIAQSLTSSTLTRFTNTSSGRIDVAGTVQTSEFVSNGVINIPVGGLVNNTASNLVLGGGSRTFIGTAANPGGAINLSGGTTIELNGALLVNNGTINGTINVNFGSLAKGSGAYGVVNVNQGGIYAPGNSPGISTATAMTFDNSPTMSGAPTLMMELAGTAPGTGFDQLHVTGQLSLGGTLAVSLIEGFTPAAGNSFDILDWGTLSGTFSTINLPTLSGLAWNTSQLYSTGVLSVVAGLVGDYNQNGTVDAADYVVWRNNIETNNVLPNDPIGGTIGTAHYSQWRSRFGQTTSSGAGAGTNAAVPEPATLVLMILAGAGVSIRRRWCTSRIPKLIKA